MLHMSGKSVLFMSTSDQFEDIFKSWILGSLPVFLSSVNWSMLVASECGFVIISPIMLYFSYLR